MYDENNDKIEFTDLTSSGQITDNGGSESADAPLSLVDDAKTDTLASVDELSRDIEPTVLEESTVTDVDSPEVKDATSDEEATSEVETPTDGSAETPKKSRSKKEIVKYALKLFGDNMFDKIKEAVISVLPITILILGVALAMWGKFTTQEYVAFSVSAVGLIVGIALFSKGAEIAMTPMGTMVGVGLTKSRKLWLLLPIAFVMGLLITIAEPDLSVLAEQVSAVMNKTLLIATVGVGVGLFLVVGIARIVYKKDLSALLMFFYMVLFAMSALLIDFGKSPLMPLSFDSGGVTTGPITVPFIMALGIGVALTIGGHGSKENSFGLVSLCSIGPMLAVLALSFFAKGDLTYETPNYSMNDSIANFAGLLTGTMKEVAISLGLMIVFFVVLQIFILKVNKNKLLQIAIGIIYTFVGLVIFLTSATVGFMPMGYKLGVELANFNPYLLIAFAFVIGLVVVLAEPAVQVLKNQVEEITNGTVSKRSMVIALSIGVGASIGLSVLRIIKGFSLLYYLIPGYLISLGLSLLVPKLYTAIAFDSGGVASGPLTSSFILPLAIGACTAIQGEDKILDFAFGVVAMVAMTPLIAIQLLGFRAITVSKIRYIRAMKRINDAEDEQVIDFM